MSIVTALLSRFVASRSGGVALLFGLSMFGIAGLTGAAVDYSNASRVRAGMSAVADAAALAGAKAGADHINANGLSSLTRTQAETLARQAAEAMLHTSNQPDSTRLGQSHVVDVTMSDTGISVRVRVNDATSTTLMAVIGINSMGVEAVSTAAQRFKQYVQVLFLLDISQSMGIGGTAAAISQLETLIGCAFACHTAGPVTASYPNTRQTARTAGIELKIDHLRSAVSAFVARIANVSPAGQTHFRVGIYTTGKFFNELAAVSTNMAAAQTAVSTLDMEVADVGYPINGVTAYGWTSLNQGLTELNSRITQVGNGVSPSSQKTYVVFVTDGLQNVPMAGPWERQMNVDYAAECAALKRSGAIEVYTIHARTPPFAHAGYYDLIQPYQALIETRLRQCATVEANYFLATDGPAVQAAVNEIAQRIVSVPRLTQ